MVSCVELRAQLLCPNTAKALRSLPRIFRAPQPDPKNRRRTLIFQPRGILPYRPCFDFKLKRNSLNSIISNSLLFFATRYNVISKTVVVKIIQSIESIILA